jgi:ribonuclease E
VQTLSGDWNARQRIRRARVYLAEQSACPLQQPVPRLRRLEFMANNKMLIDASHPEETRVAVVRGNRIEEFDFESQAKKQLRGNIYLAKITRVEPSLQAAFVDYGGNRHGFLAFSEIHPDYYQIPVADRQALLEEEAREAAELGDEEDGEQRRSRRRRGRRDERGGRRERRPASAEAGDDSEFTSPEYEAEAEYTDAEEYEAADAAPAGGDNDSDGGDDGDDSGPARSVAAMVHVESVSEPADEDGSGDEESADAAGKAEEAAPAKAKAKRAPRRTTKRKAAKAEDDAVAAEEVQPAAAPEETQAESAAGEIVADAAEDVSPDETDSEADSSAEESRRVSDRDGNGGEAAEEEEHVESVGQEDALEELPQRFKPRRQYKIQEVIKRRQILLVQVVKEERGNKGAALTTYLSLAGRYSVLMPNTARGGGISRKITNAADRKRLKAIASELEVPKGMGVILRTAGAARTKAEIKRDFEYLMRLWDNVRTLTLSSTAPCLVYEEGSLIKRSIRDLYDKDTGEVLVVGEEGYREAKDFMRMLMPSHAKNVKPYQEEQAIFSKFGVETQLDRLLSPQVTLKSGGYVVINQTEALVSIDVNSGRSTREHSIEDTALQTNLEAADEIARQLRLRDLAGLIVIDFIDMEEKRNNRSVEKRLKEALKNDRARIQVGRISHFGLLEMSRQRIRASVMESTMEVCPHCGGLGHVRSGSSIALHVFRAIEDHLGRHGRYDVVVRCPVAIALDVLNLKRAGLSELEARHGVRIFIRGDASLPGQSFQIEKGAPATRTPRKSVVSAPIVEEEDEFVEEIELEDDEEEMEAAPAARDRDRERRGGDDGQEERGGRKRRRRRRRGRRGEGGAEGATGHGEPVYASSPSNADEHADEDEAEAEAAETIGGAAAEEAAGDASANGQRKRRRGKRGGRRSREGTAEAQASEELEDGAEDAATSRVDEDETDADVAGAEESGDTSETEVTAEPEASQAAEEPEGEAVAPDDTPGGKPATRRRAFGSAGTPAEAAPAEAETAQDDDKPKRQGWWRRGGFF